MQYKNNKTKTFYNGKKATISYKNKFLNKEKDVDNIT